MDVLPKGNNPRPTANEHPGCIWTMKVPSLWTLQEFDCVRLVVGDACRGRFHLHQCLQFAVQTKPKMSNTDWTALKKKSKMIKKIVKNQQSKRLILGGGAVQTLWQVGGSPSHPILPLLMSNQKNFQHFMKIHRLFRNTLGFWI